jgi:hypothetical protein
LLLSMVQQKYRADLTLIKSLFKSLLADSCPPTQRSPASNHFLCQRTLVGNPVAPSPSAARSPLLRPAALAGVGWQAASTPGAAVTSHALPHAACDCPCHAAVGLLHGGWGDQGSQRYNWISVHSESFLLLHFFHVFQFFNRFCGLLPPHTRLSLF